MIGKLRTASRRMRRRTGAIVLAALAVTGVTATLGVTAIPTTAYADNYPTWNDVVAARNSEAAAQAQVANIQSLIAGLSAQVAATQAAAQQAWEQNNAAQQAFTDGTFRAQQLELQATEASAKADGSRKQAAQLTAQLARTAGNDLTVRLFTSTDGGDDLLYQLGAMSKLSTTSQTIFEQASQDANTARSLTDQASVAKEQLGALAAAAQSSLDQAVAAQQAASAALIEQENKQIELTVLLQALTEDRAMTEDQYNAGVEAERQRRIREAEDQRPRPADTPSPSSPAPAPSAPAPSTPAPSNPPVFNPPPARGDGQAIVDYAMQFVGKVPYGYGADPSDSFGCDGLTQYVYKMVAGIYLPRLVSNQAAMGVPVSRSAAQPGDLVVWPGHIGIYAGGNMVIHSPDWGRYVTYAGIWGSPSFVRIL